MLFQAGELILFMPVALFIMGIVNKAPAVSIELVINFLLATGGLLLGEDG